MSGTTENPNEATNDVIKKYTNTCISQNVFFFQQLSEKFRYHYSKLWLSIIDRNRDQMRVHAEELGIRKELYGLFACMVTGRPWDSIMKGIGRTRPTSDEVGITTRF